MMVENSPFRTILTHAVLIIGIFIIIFPIYITLVASTHRREDISTTVQPWFGDQLIENYTTILLPLSRTNIAALTVILFIYGWNQYLWPLLITTDPKMMTIVMGVQRMLFVADSIPEWHLTMAFAILAMLPPVVVVLVMQRQFVKGLIETEK